MWTPRRLGLLLVGLLVFGGAFTVYSRLLGAIDGLPPLPEAYLQRRAPGENVDPVMPASRTALALKLQQAFPGPCPEKDYTIQLELGKKGIIIAADKLTFKDGAAVLEPFSIATFRQRAGQLPEINAIHSDIAYLYFDKPVNTLPEMGQRKIVGCDLASDTATILDKSSPYAHDPRRQWVWLSNNRGTADPADDLKMRTRGPVSYRETDQPNAPLETAKPQIWTDAAIELEDAQDPAHATKITAVGMQVFLAADVEDKSGKPAAKPKQAQGSIGGVRRLVLRQDVRMDLWLEPGGGFVAASDKKPVATAKPGDPPAKPPEKTKLQITTAGPFFYDVGEANDRARFERKASVAGDRVHVRRPLQREAGIVTDQLDSDFLELQFAHKPKTARTPAVAATAPAKTPGGDSTLDWVHAWGDNVLVTSEDEHLVAHGNDLHHDARLKRTTLQGMPMEAVKDGNTLQAAELVMFGTDSVEGQQAVAKRNVVFTMSNRPDNIGFADAAAVKPANAKPAQARCVDQLVFRKIDTGEMIHLTGSAEFEDAERNQRLMADQLKLFLAPSTTPVAATDKASGRKPQRLEALGHVKATSPELRVHDTDQMVVLFKDGPPNVPPVGRRPGDPLRPIPAGPDGSPVPPPAPALAGAATIPGATVAAVEPAKPPIDLTARAVQVFVTRSGERNDLDTVRCEGRVRVHQDPAPPQTKPVDMRGQTLDLEHHLDGSILVVTGDATSLAEVHLPDLSLIGPSVKIDQRDNVAEVIGNGSMKLASQTDFQGKKLAKPQDILILWKDRMHFAGKLARFEGSVQASQEQSTLLCQTMQVYLNRTVSLAQRSGGGSDGPANVDKVICDMAGAPQPAQVIVEEATREAGKLVKYQRIECREMDMDKEDGRMNASGPGNVRTLQMGTKDNNAGSNFAMMAQPKKPVPAAPPEQEMKLTWVRFAGRMAVNNTHRTVQFFGNVEVVNLPSDDPGLRIDIDEIINRPPTGAMYLHSDRLSVREVRDSQLGRTTRELDARQHASIISGEFSGEADVIKYDEAKKMVTLEGENGGYAKIFKFKVRGSAPDSCKAKVIRYKLDTREHVAEGIVDSYGGGG